MGFTRYLFCCQLVPADEALEAALRCSAEAGLPSINVARNQGKFLQLLARIRGARRILEIGTLGGYSSIWLARGLSSGGTLVTLEANPDYAAVATKNIAFAGFSETVSVMVGPAMQTLAQLIDEKAEPFDMVFIDADKKTYPDYLQLSLELCRPGAIIVGDNVIRKGRMTDFASTDPDVIGLRKYFDLLGKHPKLDSTAVQTAGSKGWDGFSISILSA
ncbi:Catechol O-methyltransferase (plasmid) [Caballeronia sp. SBC1]|nr:Catechol O-methyltransferase [Caballeronia sp. SBC2]QIN63732.1 Catechol O-methyltransferase [Caballeronia sp. SBC1]